MKIEIFSTMLSVGRCQQLYKCLHKTTSNKDVINVYTNISPKSVCSYKKNPLYPSQCRHMSINNDSQHKNQSYAEKLLEDATVPEELTVEGDTNNWTTSPYPKG